MSDVLWQALDYLEQGGWIMVPLAVCSLAMWILILERLRTYHKMMSGDIGIDRVLRLVAGDSGELESEGLRGRLVRAFQNDRSGRVDIDRKILRLCADRLRFDLKRFLPVIAVLASVAPLLGLLGTVLGMMETFNVISVFGTGNAKAMAGGISVALVTTQTGLLVAIPGLFLSGWLVRRSQRLETRLDEITTVIDRHLKKVSGQKGSLR